jgi:hypothetical protein
LVWKAREITQLGYVCRNLEDAIAYFVERQGAGPFYTMDVPADAAEYTFKGQTVSGVTKNRVAFGYRGRNQFELIETDNPIFDHLRGDRDMVYHHCMQMSDTFNADRLGYEKAGFATLGTGKMPGVLIHYIDTMEVMGHYTELFDYNAAMAETEGFMFGLFEKMYDAANDWDGTRPARPIEELFA